MYVHVCVCVYIFIYTYIYIYTHIRTYVRMYVRTYTCAYISRNNIQVQHACVLEKLLQNAHPYMKTLAAQSKALCLLVRQLFPHNFCIEPFSKLTAALLQSLIPNDQIGMHLIN